MWSPPPHPPIPPPRQFRPVDCPFPLEAVNAMSVSGGNNWQSSPIYSTSPSDGFSSNGWRPSPRQTPHGSPMMSRRTRNLLPPPSPRPPLFKQQQQHWPIGGGVDRLENYNKMPSLDSLYEQLKWLTEPESNQRCRSRSATFSGNNNNNIHHQQQQFIRKVFLESDLDGRMNFRNIRFHPGTATHTESIFTELVTPFEM